MFYVYVLYDGKRFYIGMTADIDRLTAEHKGGWVKSTKYRQHLELIYYEAFRNKVDAARRERYFKTNKGKKALKLMLREELNNYSGVV